MVLRRWTSFWSSEHSREGTSQGRLGKQQRSLSQYEILSWQARRQQGSVWKANHCYMLAPSRPSFLQNFITNKYNLESLNGFLSNFCLNQETRLFANNRKRTFNATKSTLVVIKEHDFDGEFNTWPTGLIHPFKQLELRVISHSWLFRTCGMLSIIKGTTSTAFGSRDCQLLIDSSLSKLVHCK